MENKEILKELKHLQKLVKENKFKQEGQYSDGGEYRSGVFVKSKIVESKISSLINKILKYEKKLC